MSKMREAFEAWYKTRRYVAIFARTIASDGFEAGYQAAIAAVKEGGVCGFIGQHTSGTPLYKLPEDTP